MLSDDWLPWRAKQWLAGLSSILIILFCAGHVTLAAFAHRTAMGILVSISFLAIRCLLFIMNIIPSMQDCCHYRYDNTMTLFSRATSLPTLSAVRPLLSVFNPVYILWLTHLCVIFSFLFFMLTALVALCSSVLSADCTVGYVLKSDRPICCASSQHDVKLILL